MTPDLDEIRAALAAATPHPWSCWNAFTFADRIDMMATVRITRADLTLVANAPTWLAALCSEVERLRVEVSREPDHSVGYTLKLMAERDAALEKYEVLREQYVNDTDTKTIKLRAERDAALAEVEQLRNGNFVRALAVTEQKRDAWRACADQLNEELREALSYVPKHFVIKHAIGAEALAVYEQLKGADS